MSLLERVQAIEDERRGEDDGRVRIGIETLRSAVGEIVPLDRVAAMADESPERARNEVRAACRRAAMHDPWRTLDPLVFRGLVNGLIDTIFGFCHLL